MDILNLFKSFEKDFNLPNEFFNNLFIENDWSFVIKSHSLLESLVTSLIVHHFREPSISEVVSRLEMSNAQTGKIAILKNTKLLGKNNIKFIIALSELRNILVHRIENVSFTFDEWTLSMDKNQLRSNALKFNPLDSTYISINVSLDKAKKQGKKHPDKIDTDLNKIYSDFKLNTKEYIIKSLYNLLVSISEAKDFSDYAFEVKYETFIKEY